MRRSSGAVSAGEQVRPASSSRSSTLHQRNPCARMRDEIAVFDIDGTLADVSERLHHVRAKPKNWNAFFAAMAQDKAIASMVRLCNLLHEAGVRIVLCSGRPERYRTDTLSWLAREGVRYDELRLRRDGDRRSDTISKREMLAGIDPAHVLFIVEDRASVVEMWRAQGFVCLQCAPGEF
jgi:FMN phosphatase YigB (HAD superfamily)